MTHQYWRQLKWSLYCFRLAIDTPLDLHLPLYQLCGFTVGTSISSQGRGLWFTQYIFAEFFRPGLFIASCSLSLRTLRTRARFPLLAVEYRIGWYWTNVYSLYKEVSSYSYCTICTITMPEEMLSWSTTLASGTTILYCSWMLMVLCIITSHKAGYKCYNLLKVMQ